MSDWDLENDGNPDAEPESEASAAFARGGGPTFDEARLKTWIARVVEQDEAALGLLYDALIGRVYGLALRITAQAQTAEEVAGDTFWQVWRQAPRFDPARGSALAWVMTIARSRALDARRAVARVELDTNPDLLAGIPAEAADIADLAASAEEGRRLHEALARLDPVPRQLVAMAFFRGLSHEEIAAELKLPLGTVKSHIRRALQRLRQWLDPPVGGAKKD